MMNVDSYRQYAADCLRAGAERADAGGPQHSSQYRVGLAAGWRSRPRRWKDEMEPDVQADGDDAPEEEEERQLAS